MKKILPYLMAIAVVIGLSVCLLRTRTVTAILPVATTQHPPAPSWVNAGIEGFTGENAREVQVEMKFFKLSYEAEAEDVPAERYQKRMTEMERQAYFGVLKERGRLDMIDGSTLVAREGGVAHFEPGQALSDSGNLRDQFEQAGTGPRVSQHVRVTPLPDGKSAKVDVFVEVKEVKGFHRDESGVEQPVIDARRVDASFELSYGETVALGGLVTRDQQDIEDKVLFLGDIPAIGRVFRWRTTQELPRELIVMITPRLLSTVEVSGKSLISLTNTSIETVGSSWLGASGGLLIGPSGRLNIPESPTQ